MNLTVCIVNELRSCDIVSEPTSETVVSDAGAYITSSPPPPRRLTIVTDDTAITQVAKKHTHLCGSYENSNVSYKRKFCLTKITAFWLLVCGTGEQ